ncbi:MAG TPA: four helix bundle protein [Steroidobacteraceae bacterium]|jgi:hypothetical protein
MGLNLPPLVKQAESLQAQIELAAARFPRAHRYSLGTELRSDAMAVVRLGHKAWRAKFPEALLDQLSDAIDDLKLRLQLAQRIQAFASFAQFEALAREAASLGRQCGGLRKKRPVSGQNARGEPPAQRSRSLSSRAASSEANS